MNTKPIVVELVAILKEVQLLLGHEDADKITPSTCPHGGMKGFQSDIVPTIVRRLASRLGQPLPEDTDIVNIFTSDDKTEKLTIEGAAKRFHEKYSPKGNT
jgi:hypothetical protein